MHASKVNRKMLQVARRNGARIVDGRKHIKVYDGNVLVVVLSHGSKRTRDDRFIKVAFAKRGWA